MNIGGEVDLEKENLLIVENLKILKTISQNINSICDYHKNFCFVKLIHGDTLLIWASIKHSLEIYDLNKEKLVDSINAHNDWINSCEHFYDPFKNIDVIVTCSDDMSVKLWEVQPVLSKDICYLKNFMTIKQDNIGYPRTAYMFTDFLCKQNFILVELSNYVIQLFNQNGKYLKQIDSSYFCDIYVDDKKEEYYIVTFYFNRVKFLDLKTFEIRKEFLSDGKVLAVAIVNNLIIISDELCNLKSFNILTLELVNEVKVDKFPINLIEIWDIEFFFAGNQEGKLCCFETKTLMKIRTLDIFSLEKIVHMAPIIHPLHGPSLILSGSDKSNKGMLMLLKLDKNSLNAASQ
jgi:WD40 repeat protein